MRPSVIIAKLATRAAWPITRGDRVNGRLAPPVLCYHRVLPRNAKTGALPAYSVTPEQFRAQMTLIADEGFTSLTFDQFYQAAKDAREIPDRSILITFDDGYRDNYELAWPIARQLGMKLNLFVCTGLIDRKSVDVFQAISRAERASQKEFSDLWQPISWAQLREMKSAGVGVGFHSHSHRNLAAMSAIEMTEDIEKGMALFQAGLGVRPRMFAFPFGHFGSYSRTAMAILKEHGLEIFFTTELGRTPLEPGGHLFSRLVVHPEDDLRSFRRKLYGGYDWMGRLRKHSYSVRASFSGIRSPATSEPNH